MSVRRVFAIILMTVEIAVIVALLFHSSQDTHWGAGFWRSWLMKELGFTSETVTTLVFWLRKIIHFIGYGFLGVLFLFYFRLWGTPKPALWAVILTLLIASADEWLQAHSSFRTGQLTDVLIDAAGLLLIQWLALRIWPSRAK